MCYHRNNYDVHAWKMYKVGQRWKANDNDYVYTYPKRFILLILTYCIGVEPFGENHQSIKERWKVYSVHILKSFHIKFKDDSFILVDKYYVQI